MLLLRARISLLTEVMMAARIEERRSSSSTAIGFLSELLANTRVISAPHGTNVPTAPVSRNILLIAIVLGLGIPFAIIYLREMMNTTVRGKSDIDGVKG